MRPLPAYSSLPLFGLTDTTVGPGDAVGAYPGGHRDPDPGDRQYVNNTPDAWRHYDWSLVTTVDTFTNFGAVDASHGRRSH